MVKSAIGALLLVLTAATWTSAYAQAAIAGVVRDPKGDPIPGISVEASSPSLIEKARTTLTDRTGRYRLEDLRPGVYTVRFTRNGWSPYQQGGIELTGSFTAIVNAELAIGPVTEAVTVTADVPAVDVQSAEREVNLSSDVVRSIPTVRSYNALLVLVPGVVTNTNDIVTGTATTSFPIHGGRVAEGRLMLDGLTLGSPPSGNSATSYVFDVGQAQEVTFTTTGALGEAETGGLVMNIVPRGGGNTPHGSLFVSVTGEDLHGDNLTRSLEEQGVTAATPLRKVYDVSGAVGGPIRKDRLWYFLNGSLGASTRDVPNVFYNLNAGDSRQWLYAPDSNRREYSDRTVESVSGRVTWQVTPRHRIGAFLDAQSLCRTCTGATPGPQEPARVSPEAVGTMRRPLTVSQVTWLSPVSNRLLLEAGFGGMHFSVGNRERTPNPTRDLIRVAEQCATGCSANGGIPGLVYRSQDFTVSTAGSYFWRGSLSYVTGSHSLKVGYQHTFMTDDRTWFTNNQQLTYRVSNGVPNQLTQSISPWVNNTRVAWQAVYLQEQWTRDRVTLQGAVRFDRARSWFPEQQEGPSRFLPAPIVFPETRGVDSYKDITVRGGAIYDVSGNGRTAVKASVGKYLEGAGVTGNYANSNPTLRMPQTTPVFGTSGVTRAWDDANRNFVPDCDLSNPLAQDLRLAGGDLCGVISNTDFGRNVLTNNFDAAVLNGWGVRPSDWNVAVSLQQQLGSRSSLDVTYNRRSYQGFFAADNLALQPADLTPFSIVAPVDERLPGGGGYVVSDLYDVVPEKSGQVDNFITDSRKFGAWSQYFNGIDVTVNARLGRSFVLVGGTSTGQTVADNCAVRARLPEVATTTTGTSPFGAGLTGSAVTPVSPYCHVAYGILTQVRGLAWYLIPKVDLQVSTTFQSKAGAMQAANYAATESDVVASLQRPLSGDAANVTVNLVAPGKMYGDRVNQVDVRLGRTIRYGRSRTLVALDIYNALNSSAVLSYNHTFVPGGPWLQPLSILTPRFFKITAEVIF